MAILRSSVFNLELATFWNVRCRIRWRTRERVLERGLLVVKWAFHPVTLPHLHCRNQFYLEWLRQESKKKNYFIIRFVQFSFNISWIIVFKWKFFLTLPIFIILLSLFPIILLISLNHKFKWNFTSLPITDFIQNDGSSKFSQFEIKLSVKGHVRSDFFKPLNKYFSN